MVLESPGSGIDFILLADDDQDDVFLFEESVRLLKQAPTVVVATDGVSALEKLALSPLPVLIFLDINMPRMNGLECFSRIRMDARIAGVPVLFLSTSSNQHFVDEAKRLGARGYIQKPSSFIELHQIIAEVISRECNRLHQTTFYTYINQ